MASDFLEILRSTRSDYDKEVVWVRYLLDAYGGTGGISGRIEQPALSSLGWVADVYGTGSGFGGVPPGDIRTQSDTYLDQYPREDQDKFLRRQALAHYDNYVQTILDLLISYALKSPSRPENLPNRLEQWRENVTLTGINWIDLFNHVIARRTALMGWIPMLIDQLPREAGLSEAQVSATGSRLDPYVTPLTPANLLDWYIDPVTGVMIWAKFKFTERRQPDPLQPAFEVTIIKIFSATEIKAWEVNDEEETAVLVIDTTHPFGAVPMVSFQQRPNIEEPVRGTSMVGDTAIAMRRLFNLGSELDEHIRSDVFALLQVPVPAGQEPPNELLVGGGNAVAVPSDSQRDYMFISPDSSVAATIEKRIENMRIEVYRRARVQIGGDTRTQQSGIAKAWDFEETNRLLNDFVGQLARSEKQVYVLVGTGMGLAADVLNDIKIVPPSDFAVQDLMADLGAAEAALALDMGAEIDYLIKRRMVPRILPDLSQEDAQVVDDSLQQQRDETLNSDAESDEIEAAEATEPEPEEA